VGGGKGGGGSTTGEFISAEINCVHRPHSDRHYFNYAQAGRDLPRPEEQKKDRGSGGREGGREGERGEGGKLGSRKGVDETRGRIYRAICSATRRARIVGAI